MDILDEDPVFDGYDWWQVDASGIAIEEHGGQTFLSRAPIPASALRLVRRAR